MQEKGLSEFFSGWLFSADNSLFLFLDSLAKPVGIHRCREWSFMRPLHSGTAFGTVHIVEFICIETMFTFWTTK